MNLDISSQRRKLTRFQGVTATHNIMQVLSDRRVLPNIRESRLSSLVFQAQNCLTEQGFRAGLIPQWPIFVSLQPCLAQTCYHVIYNGLILIGKYLCKMLQRELGVYS